MIEPIIEHKIQTAIQGATHIIRYGGVANASGDVQIDFGFTFVQKPVVFVQVAEDSADETVQPVCYVKSWVQDSNDYYTGCVVHSDGKGDGIMWMAIGIGVVTGG